VVCEVNLGENKIKGNTHTHTHTHTFIVLQCCTGLQVSTAPEHGAPMLLNTPYGNLYATKSKKNITCTIPNGGHDVVCLPWHSKRGFQRIENLIWKTRFEVMRL